MKEFVKTLTKEFSDKEYAHSYVNEILNLEIATQIKTLREQRKLTQKQLADLAGMKQERICALENVDHSAWTAKTLRAIANAFDVALKISFEEFGDRILDIDSYDEKSCFERDTREKSLSKMVHYYDDDPYKLVPSDEKHYSYVTAITVSNSAPVFHFKKENIKQDICTSWDKISPETVPFELLTATR